MTLDEAKSLAKEVSEGKSRSYVQAAQTLATFLLTFEESTLQLSNAEAAQKGSAVVCESCETRPASKWCNGCIVEDHQAAQMPSVPVEIGPPLTFNGHGNFDLEPESSRRPSVDGHVGCVSGGGPTCIYLKDGSKVRIWRDPETTGRAWVEHVPQDDIGPAKIRGGCTPLDHATPARVPEEAGTSLPSSSDPPTCDQLCDAIIDAARAVVRGRIPAVSAELAGSEWKHSRISDSLTDKLAATLRALDAAAAAQKGRAGQ